MTLMYLIDAVYEMNAVAVIHPRKNRKFQIPYDARLCKQHNQDERLLLKMKRF